MAGQQQIKQYNRKTLFDKNFKELNNQAEQYYIDKKFAIKNKYKEELLVNSFILQDVLCTENCEIIKFLDKKLRGALGDENIDIVDLKTMQTKYRDINNYYYSSANYEQVDW